MLRFLDLWFIVLFAVALPLLTVFYFYPKLKRSIEAGLPDARLNAYRGGIIIQWLLAGVAVGLWLWSDRSLQSLGAGWVERHTTGVGYALLVGLILALIFQRRRILRSSKIREKARASLVPVKPILPHTRQELEAFYVLSVSAGACEEVLYRGFLMGTLVPVAGVELAYGLSSLLFGFAHLYQGGRGVVRTTWAGLVFGGFYLLTGSLWASIILHIYQDINSGQVAYKLVQAEGASPDQSSASRVGFSKTRK